MLKRLKSVSMLLFLMRLPLPGSIRGHNPGVTDENHTTDRDMYPGIVKDATGEGVIGASVVVKGLRMVLSQGLTVTSL